VVLYGPVRRVLVLAVALSLAFGAAAVAASSLPNTLAFEGNSARGHFAIEIITACNATDPHCANRSNRKTTVVNFSINLGPPNRKCLATGELDTFNIPLKGNSFKQTAGSEDVIFTVSGTFHGTKRVSGKIVAPRSCGGTDLYNVRYKGTWPEIGHTGYPPHGV
jgi:hypothetical protein